MDLARIKFGEYEIDFMDKRSAFTENERKSFLENYKLVSQFHGLFLRDNYIGREALGLIWKARDDARLYLPDEIVAYLENILKKATKSYALKNHIDKIAVGEKRNKKVDEESAKL